MAGHQPLQPPPIRGVGEGLLGRPEASAAPTPPDPHAARVARQKENDALVGKMRSELAAAALDGSFVSVDVGECPDVNKYFAELPDSVVKQQYAEFRSVMDDRKEAAPASPFRDPEPGDPDYSPVMDTKRRAKIEKSLVQMDLSQLLFAQRVTQDVPLEMGVTLRFGSLVSAHTVFMSRLASKRLREESTQTYDDTVGIWRLALSLDAYGAPNAAGKVEWKPMPSPEIAKITNLSDEKAFETWTTLLDSRVEVLSRLPVQLLSEFRLQSYWFELRVAQLISRGNLSERLGKS